MSADLKVVIVTIANINDFLVIFNYWHLWSILDIDFFSIGQLVSSWKIIVADIGYFLVIH